MLLLPSSTAPASYKSDPTSTATLSSTVAAAAAVATAAYFY